MELLTVRQFAKCEGITPQAVNQKTKNRGVLEPFLYYVPVKGGRKEKRLDAAALSDQAKERYEQYRETFQSNNSKSGQQLSMLVKAIQETDEKEQIPLRDSDNVSKTETTEECCDNVCSQFSNNVSQHLINLTIEELLKQLNVKDAQLNAKDSQIQAKDDQLRAKDEQIARIQEQLDSAMRIVDQTQKLQAHERLMLEPKKESGFLRWFNSRANLNTDI